MRTMKSFFKLENTKNFKLNFKHKTCLKLIKLFLIFITVTFSTTCKPLSIQTQLNQQAKL